MTLEITILIAIMLVLIIAVALIMFDLDKRARKKYMELRAAQEEQWQITEQFHQSMAQILQEVASRQLNDTAPPHPDGGGRTYTVQQGWR